MKLRKNVAVSEAGLVFNPVSGESFTVNPIGIEIIDLLREEKSFKEIADHLCRQYTIDNPTFEKDYQDFVIQLEQFNLVENEEKKA